MRQVDVKMIFVNFNENKLKKVEKKLKEVDDETWESHVKDDTSWEKTSRIFNWQTKGFWHSNCNSQNIAKVEDNFLLFFLQKNSKFWYFLWKGDDTPSHSSLLGDILQRLFCFLQQQRQIETNLTQNGSKQTGSGVIVVEILRMKILSENKIENYNIKIWN